MRTLIRKKKVERWFSDGEKDFGESERFLFNDLSLVWSESMNFLFNDFKLYLIFWFIDFICIIFLLKKIESAISKLAQTKCS